MLLSLFAITAGSFGVLNAGQGAVLQEFIDVIAILWALTTLIERSSKRPPRLDAG